MGCCTCPTPVVEWRTTSIIWNKCGYESPDDGQIYLNLILGCSSGSRTTYDMDPAACTESVTTDTDYRCCDPFFVSPDDGKSYLAKKTTWDFAHAFTEIPEFPEWYPTTPDINCDVTVTGKVVMQRALKGDITGGTDPYPGLGYCDEIDPDFTTDDTITTVNNRYFNVATWTPPEDEGTRPPDTVTLTGHERYTTTWTRTGGGTSPTGHKLIIYQDIFHSGSPSTYLEQFDIPIEEAIGFSCAGISTGTVTDEYTGEAPSITDEYSTPHTTETMIENAIANTPAYSGSWTRSAFDDDWDHGSEEDISEDETSVAMEQTQFRLRVPPIAVGSGKIYKVSWLERKIRRGGVPLTSLEVRARGVFRPAVTWTGGGGSGLELVAVMAADGSVDAIRVANPGSGFTEAPTITVAASSATTSTGWVATLEDGEDGRVATVSRDGGTAGNYLPTAEFSDPPSPYRRATVAFTLDEQGGIATASLTDAGTGYNATPTLTITAKTATWFAPELLVHLGTETPRCIAWDGVRPSGYDPEDWTTWPILAPSGGHFNISLPGESGTVRLHGIRVDCRSTTPCP
jgi:hypothetical protein